MPPAPISMRPALKWTALVVGGLAVLLVIAGAALWWAGSANIDQTYDVAVADLAIPGDSLALARGAHLAGIYGCRDCHAQDLTGTVMEEEGPVRIVAPNLTPAGVGARYDAEDWDRAIRHGVAVDGTALFAMPSAAYHGLSDADMADLIAYLDRLDPIDADLPPMKHRALGRVLAAGPMDPGAGVVTGPTRPTGPAPGATVAYGEYIATTICAYCHGDRLEGKEGLAPGSPYAPDLAPVGTWPRELFHEVMTTGTLPGGRQMDPAVMPWTMSARMTEAEREGVRLYLATLADPRDA